jgi:phosphatidylglycerol:prolipoprotein diacylglycerol transferase
VFPRLISIGPFTLYTYGLLLAVAFIAGLWLATRRARRAGLDPARALDLGVLVIIAAIVGARLLMVVVDGPSILRDPAQLIAIARAGGVFYGGLLAAVGTALWYLRRHAMPLWATCDAFAPGIALGHVVGRLGCLMAGCCYGRPTDLPWAVTFHDPFTADYVGAPTGVPLHPTQLYEAGAEAAILVLLLALERRGRSFPGRTFWAYMALYASSRFVIEFFRGDPRGAFGPLSTSQAIAVAILPCSLIMLALLARRPHAAAPAHGRPTRSTHR